MKDGRALLEGEAGAAMPDATAAAAVPRDGTAPDGVPCSAGPVQAASSTGQLPAPAFCPCTSSFADSGMTGILLVAVTERGFR